MIKFILQSLYLLVAIIFLSIGVGALLFGTNSLPDKARTFMLDVARSNHNSLHLIQEMSCFLVLTGLVTIWFALHYDQCRLFHWAMTLFWGLFAWVHWFDVHGQFHRGTEPLTITIPFAVFFLVGLLRQQSG